MKKIFLSAVIALALCSYGYAQDDEEYEEEEAPAKVEKKAPAYEEEEEEDEAPVAKKAEKKKEKKKSSGNTNGFFGAGIDVGGLLNNSQVMRLAFRLNENMELSALLGMWHHGENTSKPNVAGAADVKGQDNNTYLAIGAGFDFFVVKNIVPVSIGAELIYSTPTFGEVAVGDNNVDVVGANKDIDMMQIDFNILAGGHAELVSGLILTGKVGLAINYFSVSTNGFDGSRVDFGLATRVYLTWFMF